MTHHRCQYSLSGSAFIGEKKKVSLFRGRKSWADKVVLVFLGALLAVFVCASVQAQLIGGDQTEWKRDEEPPLVEEEKTGQPARVVEPTSPAPPKTGTAEFPLERVYVGKIIVTGSTVFSAEELAEITAPFANRELTAEDLEELRRDLTLYYVNKGYVNSGAIIPDQAVADGIVKLQVIEGELTAIEVEGNKWFRDSYIRNRIALDAGPPLNISDLQTRLRLLQQDDRILLVNAELRPGIKPGESTMNVAVEERNPFRVSFILDNYQSPSVGNPRGLVNAVFDNLAGLGDSLNLTAGYSEGLTPLVDARYTLPITARDTYLSLRYKLEDFKIVEKPFDALDIETDVQRFEITVGHPFYRSLENEFSMALTGEYITSETTLANEPFSLSPGTQDGEMDITVLRFWQEWTSRAQRQAIAARSRLSFGLDMFGATSNPEPLPDSQFFVWLGQFQWARVLGDMGIQLILRTDLQLATEALPAVELISLGGRYSVRGYRENTLVTDNAVIASLESRIPVVRDRRWADYLQLVPFFDFGHGWNADFPNPSPDTIYSLGLGLRWGATLVKHPNDIRARFEIYYGYQLEDVEYQSTERDLQDEGISFRFILSAS